MHCIDMRRICSCSYFLHLGCNHHSGILARLVLCIHPMASCLLVVLSSLLIDLDLPIALALATNRMIEVDVAIGIPYSQTFQPRRRHGHSHHHSRLSQQQQRPSQHVRPFVQTRQSIFLCYRLVSLAFTRVQQAQISTIAECRRPELLQPLPSSDSNTGSNTAAIATGSNVVTAAAVRRVTIRRKRRVRPQCH
jgi:hypothetical protein